MHEISEATQGTKISAGRYSILIIRLAIVPLTHYSDQHAKRRCDGAKLCNCSTVFHRYFPDLISAIIRCTPAAG